MFLDKKFIKNKLIAILYESLIATRILVCILYNMFSLEDQKLKTKSLYANKNLVNRAT